MALQNTFKALSDPTRRRILELLLEGRLTAGEIGSHFHMTGATVSHHLSILKDAGLISDERQGKYIYYELDTSIVESIMNWTAQLLGGGKQ